MLKCYVLVESTEDFNWWYKKIRALDNNCYFHRPAVLLSPMIFPSLCFTVSGFDFGLEAARAAFTALAAAGIRQRGKEE